jgi:hypothetical protein
MLWSVQQMMQGSRGLAVGLILGQGFRATKITEGLNPNIKNNHSFFLFAEI